MGGSRIGHSSFASLFVALVACSSSEKVERHQLPGFSIELTTGTMVSPASAPEYNRGSLEIQDLARGRLSIVEWSAGAKLSRAELAPILTALGAIMHPDAPGTFVTETGSDGTQVDTMQVDTELAPMFLSQVTCGGRNLLIATLSAHDGRTLHHRVLTSLICTPDPALEKNLGTVNLELRLDLPGWRTLSHDDGQLVLTDGHSAMLLHPMPVTTSDELVTVLGPILNIAFSGTVTAGPQEGDRVPLQGTLDGEAVVGWAKLVPCPNSKTMVMDLSKTKAVAETVATIVGRATCAPIGAAPQVWPDAAK